MCPSAPPARFDTAPQTDFDTRVPYTQIVAAAIDYGVLNGYDGGLGTRGLADPAGPTFIGPGVMEINLTRMISSITDGLSNTLMVAEDAGRPLRYTARSRIGPGFSSGGGWADRENDFITDGFSADGSRQTGPCHTNCTNNNEVFAFHPGGANHLFADGSVRFIKETTNIRIFCRLITPDRGEIVTSTDY